MADFAFTRQDETTVASEATKVVPLTCVGHSRPITHLSFSDGISTPGQQEQYYLLSACKDNYPMLRDGITGDWIGTFIGHKGAVWNARLSLDAAMAATGSADFTAKVWDTHSGAALASLEHNHIVRVVAFPPKAQPDTVATGGMEKKLRIWDLAKAGEKESQSYEVGAGQHGGAIKGLVWTRDANVVVTAADDKRMRWWDLRQQSCIASHDLDANPGSCELNGGLDEQKDGEIITVAAGKSIYFFDGGRPGTLTKKIETAGEVASAALNGSARRVVTGSPGDTWVRIWDFDSGQEVEMGRGHHGPIWTVAFSPDGKLYGTGSEDGTVKLWKFTRGPYGLWTYR
ncbi:WD repeat protein [Piedraia hortae CBS 480.64]|uniref:Serine-threonine kinase receptor-associated protein n=1 Tax=Piedraia hortae CBS 480.64 TaxID=1314780 RepID=A0A6A7BWT1_9PEZI|nr:WD repeat protein [Piedraia hortae CBS 480.64]